MQPTSFKILLLFLASICLKAQGEQAKYQDHQKQALAYAASGIDDSAYYHCDLALQQCIDKGDSSQWPKIVDAIGKAYGRQKATLALVHYRHYLTTANHLFGQHHLVVAELNGRLGDLYRRPHIGKYYASLKHFDECIRILEAKKIRSRFLGFIYHFAANTYTRIGSYQKATNYLEKSLSIRLEQNDSLYAAQSYNDLGIALSDLGKLDKAQKAYRRGMNLIKTKEASRKEANLRATLLLNMADNFSKSEQDTNLLVLLQPALDLFSSTNDLAGLSAAHRSIGTWLIDQGKVDLGLKYLNKGLDQARTKYGNEHREIAKALVEISRAQTELNQPDNALISLQKALASLVPAVDSLDLFSKLQPDQFYAEPWILIVLHEKATLLLNEHTENQDIRYLETAFENFELAIAQMDLLRDQYLYGDDKERLFASYHHLFEEAIEAAIDLAELKKDEAYLLKAFAFQQKSRAYSLLELFQGTQAQNKLGIEDGLLEKERKFKMDIAALKAGEKTAESKNKLLEVMSEFERFTEELSQRHPAYFDIKYADQTLSLEDLRKDVLNDDDVLLQYVLTEDHLICFLSSQQYFKVFRKKINESFFTSVEQFNTLLSQPDFKSSTEKMALEMGDLGHELYRSLLADVDSFLVNAGFTNRKAYLVPDGVLNYLPFEALVASPYEPGQQLADLDFVLKNYPVAYAYSAATLRHQQRMNHGETADFDIQAFAPAFNTKQALPYAQTELAEIEKWIKGAYYYQDEVDKALFLERSGKSKILHLATHALLNNAKPLYSSLSFGDTSSVTSENHLYAYELFNLPIKAELVVLSACNTGKGPLLKGEGILSLGRGFAYAQCRSTVMSLWQVNDYATSSLMSGFYQHLKLGKTKDEALRLAKLNFIDQAKGIKAHPYFWAGFVFHGDRAPLELTSYSVNWWLWIVLACVLGILVLVVFLRKRNRV